MSCLSVCLSVRQNARYGRWPLLYINQLKITAFTMSRGPGSRVRRGEDSDKTTMDRT